MTAENGKPTFDEAIESLTGWDEIAIEKATGHTIESMTDEKTMRALQLSRAVAAVLLGRDKGMPHGEAYREVMGWPQAQVQAMFAEPPKQDVIPDEPDSESGKGGSSPVPALATSPHSASPPA
jgi:hypothetical protein